MVESTKKAAVIFHDITVDDLGQFRLAVTNDIAHMPDNWAKVKKAGEDWAKHLLIWSLHGQICLLFQFD